MIDEYKEKSIEEIVDYLINNEIGFIECDYEKVDSLLEYIKEKAKEIERLNDYIEFYVDLNNKQSKTILRNINSYNKLAKYSSDLENRINKAIELLEDRTNYCDVDFESMRFQNDVIKVLQGSDKE